MSNYTVETHDLFQPPARVYDRFQVDLFKRTTWRISNLTHQRLADSDPIDTAYAELYFADYQTENRYLGRLWQFKYTSAVAPNFDFKFPITDFSKREHEFMWRLNRLVYIHDVKLTEFGWEALSNGCSTDQLFTAF